MLFRSLCKLLFKEAQLQIVPMKECQNYLKGLGVSQTRELCAGHKVFRRIDAYKFFPKGIPQAQGKAWTYFKHFPYRLTTVNVGVKYLRNQGA